VKVESDPGRPIRAAQYRLTDSVFASRAAS